MEEFKIGDYVEVGFGENRHDNEGFSIYFRMDVEGYNEFDIEEFLESEGNILYVEKVDDESSILFAGDKKFSDYLPE